MTDTTATRPEDQYEQRAAGLAAHYSDRLSEVMHDTDHDFAIDFFVAGTTLAAALFNGDPVFVNAFANGMSWAAPSEVDYDSLTPEQRDIHDARADELGSAVYRAVREVLEGWGIPAAHQDDVELDTEIDEGLGDDLWAWIRGRVPSVLALVGPEGDEAKAWRISQRILRDMGEES